jgi:hypothetical protein
MILDGKISVSWVQIFMKHPTSFHPRSSTIIKTRFGLLIIALHEKMNKIKMK